MCVEFPPPEHTVITINPVAEAIPPSSLYSVFLAKLLRQPGALANARDMVKNDIAIAPIAYVTSLYELSAAFSANVEDAAVGAGGRAKNYGDFKEAVAAIGLDRAEFVEDLPQVVRHIGAVTIRTPDMMPDFCMDEAEMLQQAGITFEPPLLSWTA